MDAGASLRLCLDPGEILRAQGISPDPWQSRFLLCDDRRIQLLCCRGAGKSRTTSAKALHQALFHPKSLTLLVSRSLRQSMELFRYVKQGYAAIGRPVKAIRETMTELELTNGSRIVSAPGNEETIRGLQGVSLLIKDEAARIPDDLNASVTPMIAVSKGQEIDLSTPWGQRGWFWKKWTKGDNVTRFKVTWQDCPRHTRAFIEQERRDQGESWVAQEYECSFESLTGLVYPDFDTLAGIDVSPTVDPGVTPLVGGLDFGFRNPFAAVWGPIVPPAFGTIQEPSCIHLDDEIYLRETPLTEIARRLPKTVTWYADPAGAQEISFLRSAGFTIKRAINPVRAGVAAVTARIQSGRLKATRHRCPNLFGEAQLYRWPEGVVGSKEVPIDTDNHALAAVRYAVATLDRRFVNAFLRAGGGDRDAAPPELETAEALQGRRPVEPLNRLQAILNNPDAWTSLN